MNLDVHPSREQLHAWSRNELDEREEQSIEDHLLRCESCAGLVEDAEPSNDALLDILRISPASLTDTVLADVPTIDDDSSSIATIESPARSESRWQRELLIAVGGLGEVWLGVDRLLDRTVAIKYLKSETAGVPSVLRRFLYEARITARLNHPGTVQILDIHEDGPHSFYVMTLVRGRPLTNLIRATHGLGRDSPSTFNGEFSQLVRNWITIARTVAYAHSVGILHRDLKSDNVIVGDYGQVTLIDWGLAKRLEEASRVERNKLDVSAQKDQPPMMTQRGARLGTPCFMAPEQVVGASVDQRTDVWGLGAMLYKILTGAPPFTGPTTQDVLTAVQEKPVEPPHIRMPLIPKAISDACMKSLSKGPNHRYQSAESFANDVENRLTHQATLYQFGAGRQKLFDLSNDLMIAFDPTPAIVWRNAAWKSALGWDPERHYGCEPNVLVHPEDRPLDEEVLHKLQRGETASGMERRILASDGSYHWYSWTTTPLLDEGITFAIGRSIDEHVRRRLDYESLLNAAPDSTFVIDRQRKIQMANQRAIELFGYELGELIGNPIEILFPDTILDTHSQHLESYLATPGSRPFLGRKGLLGQAKDGSKFEVLIRLSPVNLQSSVQFVMLIRENDDGNETDTNAR